MELSLWQFESWNSEAVFRFFSGGVLQRQVIDRKREKERDRKRKRRRDGGREERREGRKTNYTQVKTK